MTSHELAHKLLDQEDLEVFNFKQNGSNDKRNPIIDIQKVTIGLGTNECPFIYFMQIVSLN